MESRSDEVALNCPVNKGPKTFERLACRPQNAKLLAEIEWRGLTTWLGFRVKGLRFTVI